MRIYSLSSSNRCVFCKGSKFLCGKERCPILVKLYAQQQTKPLIDSLSLEGSSPPGVFIGRIGYPYVSIGPLVPPIQGDTFLLDTPELWVGKSIDEIVNFRFQLVRGKYRVNVRNVEGERIVEATRELAMALNPADVEVEFHKKPRVEIALDDEVQPHGPSAPLKKIDVNSIKIDRRIEKAYSDTDLKASEAVLNLYRSGVLISKIQRAFSAGVLGEKKARRFVPTRWSITAVDSIISSTLMERVKANPLINEFQIYESISLDNRFIVILMPFSWSYELIEAWYPNTIWNPTGRETVIFSDHEGFSGRTTYAKIGGCYYAARLAVCEYLEKIGRQARVLILREAHPGYIMPVGVWNVRESVRNALRSAPHRFSSLREVFNYITAKLCIPIQKWLLHSTLLKQLLHQRTLEDYT
ncbi:MAG: Nre family DNA repair protein [Methanocellales archaeon]